MAFGSINFLVLIDTTQNKLISTFYPSDLTGMYLYNCIYAWSITNVYKFPLAKRKSDTIECKHKYCMILAL